MSTTKVLDNPLAGLPGRKNSPKVVKKRNRKKKANPTSPKSFRFSLDDMDRLKDLTEIVSDNAGRMRVNETLVMKALLKLGSELDPSEIIEKIKVIKTES